MSMIYLHKTLKVLQLPIVDIPENYKLDESMFDNLT